ncbi:MAG: hybrid sensor histidine kinase/response regulator [Myxococcales bacterium]|nr:hybrid sensor histidine kinase/response regulator [Myxococcales bacterium]
MGAIDPSEAPDPAVLRGVDGAVHEAQNALACARGWADLARRSGDALLQQRALDAIAPALARAGRILGGLVAPVESTTSRVDVSAVLDEVVALVEAIAHRQGVAVEREGDHFPCLCEGDPDAVAQVLTNVTLNAVQATVNAAQRGAGVGAVVLGLSVLDEVAELSVRDAAGGFATAPRREGSRDSEPGQGRGLGLAVSRALAAQMNAEFRLQEAARGVVATLTLQRSTSLLSTRPTQSLSTGGTVLVVDDDAAIAEMLSVALPLRGLAVRVATDIEDAEAVLSRELVRAAVVDLKLGAHDGASFVRDSRERYPNVRWVLVSGAAIEVEAQALADAVLRKPFALDDLVRALG